MVVVVVVLDLDLIEVAPRRPFDRKKLCFGLGSDEII